ncbi:hypothetical protein NRP93_000371 [Clostridium botulinum]|nr:hypothetical protein [Clostridium botulinum]
MLKISITELLVRILPECFLFIFIIQSLSNSKLNKNKYILSSILLSIIMYSIRLLPIHYGVHTILNIMAIILICTFINHVTTIKAITYSLILSIFLGLSESLNLFFVYKIFGQNTVDILNHPLKKCICIMPSIIILVVIALVMFRINNRRLKDVFY